jgi:dTDP-4-dehydrorhamnose 3,5-epimerase
VNIRELNILNSYEITPQKFGDSRGTFMEWFRADALAEVTTSRFSLEQANLSVSKKGVVRGIHFADVPPGQAKYVTCVHGAVLDYIVDIRVGSPTFGTWEAVRLDDEKRNAVFISEGLGHAFVALTDDAVVSYLVSSSYNPGAEHGINPLDADIALEFPAEAGTPLLSEKDLEAPSLSEARSSGLLPNYDELTAFYAGRAVR